MMPPGDGDHNTLAHAISVAAYAHNGQMDKNGEEPYILHPLRVMASFHTEELRIIAVLHDVVEDTDVTFDDLRREGFSEQVIGSLILLTKSRYEVYAHYIERLVQMYNRNAILVKIADLEDNTDEWRLGRLPLETQQRLRAKYHGARERLEDAL